MAVISDPERDESSLLPYMVIMAARIGDPEAIEMVVQHYQSYITYLSMRKLRDESGNTYYGIDRDICDRLKSKLIQAIFVFRG